MSDINILVEIDRERRRQVKRKGYTPEHDDMHKNGELAKAAAVYTLGAAVSEARRHFMELHGLVVATAPMQGQWPFDSADYKPKSRRDDLIKAAALIVAEIERLDRASSEEVDEYQWARVVAQNPRHFAAITVRLAEFIVKSIEG